MCLINIRKFLVVDTHRFDYQRQPMTKQRAWFTPL
jgi:hypothetical protein